MRRQLLPGQHYRFTLLVNQYKAVQGVSQRQLARMVGIDQGHLSKLMNGEMRFSEHYATKFIEAGIMKVDELFKGTDKMNDMARAVMGRLQVIEDKPLMERLGKLKGMGVDIMGLLDFAEKQAEEIRDRVIIEIEGSVDQKGLVDLSMKEREDPSLDRS